MILFEGIVRMEPLENLGISTEYSRETGDVDKFDTKLIPIQRDSYLGEFLQWSESVWDSEVPNKSGFLLK